MGNPRRANGHRRTQLRKRVLAHYSVCALCERPVDKTLPYTDPGAPEVDEIIPVSLGGDPLQWRNVQLAHRACNQAKSNTIGWKPDMPDRPVAQPRPSRDW